ncbi:hypothetical protein A2971_03045 [Candidatus Gottesmanbacteria bacterium RIFCSPLOWO2_01_FULL_46_21]|uniref:DNA-directed DNA polymerase n=1 Tax=Candidatus Gottesmanbacteria bacterium RIFCSPLOWO2_01_FULL_46_21 TaxID=1798393 RepID=A0A1F6AW34_9BACT|nr:MAG: hypothetical protein A2971_03045 [Candidatus Gottesmanbacteria bacterium RIFCSPLOWO2_01_FULL_46_21]
MIILLHGDDTVSSRNELHRLKAGREVRQLDGRGLTDTALTQALESGSMFGDDILVIVENLFGKLGKKQKLIARLAEIIKKSPADVIVWEDKEVGVTVTKSLGSANVQLFKTPISLFQFLDGLTPGHTKNSLLLFQKTLQTHAPELIFSMIVRRIRQLIQVADGVTPEELASWQVSRLTSQARSFTIDRLVELYRKLLDMEYSIKTGTSPFSMQQLLEQYLINL